MPKFVSKPGLGFARKSYITSAEEYFRQGGKKYFRENSVGQNSVPRQSRGNFYGIPLDKTTRNSVEQNHTEFRWTKPHGIPLNTMLQILQY